jgi:hypothetical protein
MIDNAFLAEQPTPDGTAIASSLGGARVWYEEILAASVGFKQDWRHYGRKYGWKLKIHDGSKALLELTVGAGAFRVGLAVRERELAALREDPATAPVLAAFLESKAAKEGWGIRIEVDSPVRHAEALALVRALAALRRAA